MFSASQLILTKVFCGVEGGVDFEDVYGFKAFFSEMPSYSSWATFCVLVYWSVGVLISRRIFLLNVDKIFLGRLLEILVPYASGSFKEFATVVLRRLISPAMVRWEKTYFYSSIILLRSNAVNILSFAKFLPNVTQEMPVGDVDWHNAWTQMTTFRYVFAN